MNLKALIEKRNAILTAMEELVKKADTETRAFTTEESADYEAKKAEIAQLDKTIDAMQESRSLENKETPKNNNETVEQAEERAFEAYVLGKALETRAGEQNITMSANGAIIPTTIANRIIKEVKDRCPILEKCTMYSVKGTLKVPVWGDNNGHNISVGYQEEFTEVTPDAGKFTSIDLGGYLIHATTLIGRSVENNGAFSVVDFVVSTMAEKIAIFVEGELLGGTGEKSARGALTTTNVLTAASATAVTMDELITLQSKVKQVYQKNACWTMNPETFTMLKLIKDNNGRYLIQDDITGEFPFRMLGKPVYISDNMPKVAAGAKAILYGDYSGLSCNVREKMEIQVVREKYVELHAIGVTAWMEFDSAVTDNQRLAVLTMKAAS